MAVDQTQYSVAMDTDPVSGYPMPKVSIGGASTNGGALGVDITQADAIVPMDVQNHLTQTIQAFNAVSIPLSTTSQSAWINCDGFLDVTFLLKNDASTNSYADFQYSFDGGTTIASADYTALVSSTSQNKTVNMPVKAPYIRINLANGDAGAAHTMSGWVYLRA